MRKVTTQRGTYKVVGNEQGLYAVSTGDNDDYFEFEPDATDEEIIERIDATCDDLPVGVWLSDMERIPRGIPLVLYSGEIYQPAVGSISETDDEVISSDSEYDRVELKHIDQYMIIPDFEP